MTRKQTLLALALSFTLIISMCGFSCHHAAMQSSVGVAASMKALQDSEVQLHNLGKLTDEQHIQLQQDFEQLFQLDKAVRACIYSSNAPTCIDPALTAVGAVMTKPEMVGIKDSNTKQQLQLLGQQIVAALTTLKAAL